MLLLTTFALLVACVHGRVLSPIANRIVGGTPADISEAPYTVSLLIYEVGIYFPVCGGSIVNPGVVLTTASCSESTYPNQWNLRAGSTFSDLGGQVKGVDKKVEHEQFDNIFDNDIALFYLDSPFQLGPTVAVINLPEQNQQFDNGAIGLIVGWGFIIDQGHFFNELRKTYIPVVNQTACENALDYPITENMFCAGFFDLGGAGSCDGDGGGPFVIDGTLIGTYSWANRCGKPKEPGVYTRIPNYRNWIDINIEFPPKI